MFSDDRRSRGSSEALVLPDSQHACTDGDEIVSGIERAPFGRFATTASTLSASGTAFMTVTRKSTVPPPVLKVHLDFTKCDKTFRNF